MLAAVLLTEDAKYTFAQQIQTVAVMIMVLLLTYALMLGAARIQKIIGAGGASVVSRAEGLILAAVATTNTLSGIKVYFNL